MMGSEERGTDNLKKEGGGGGRDVFDLSIGLGEGFEVYNPVTEKMEKWRGVETEGEVKGATNDEEEKMSSYQNHEEGEEEEEVAYRQYPSPSNRPRPLFEGGVLGVPSSISDSEYPYFQSVWTPTSSEPVSPSYKKMMESKSLLPFELTQNNNGGQNLPRHLDQTLGLGGGGYQHQYQYHHPLLGHGLIRTSGGVQSSSSGYSSGFPFHNNNSPPPPPSSASVFQSRERRFPSTSSAYSIASVAAMNFPSSASNSASPSPLELFSSSEVDQDQDRLGGLENEQDFFARSAVSRLNTPSSSGGSSPCPTPTPSVVKTKSFIRTRATKTELNALHDSIDITRKFDYECVFCKGNNQPDYVYKNHPLRLKDVVVCPALRCHVCRICGATGDNAHTIKYCPFNEKGFFAGKQQGQGHGLIGSNFGTTTGMDRQKTGVALTMSHHHESSSSKPSSGHEYIPRLNKWCNANGNGNSNGHGGYHHHSCSVHAPPQEPFGPFGPSQPQQVQVQQPQHNNDNDSRDWFLLNLQQFSALPKK